MIVLAFPGLGKTTLTKTQGGYVDLDFDYVRKAMSALSLSKKAQLKVYAEMAKRYADEGFSVFLNEPEVLRYCPWLSVDVMFLPEGKMIHKSALKLEVDDETAWKWRMDWFSLAVERDIQVFFTEHYLGPIVRDRAALQGQHPFIPKRVEETRERSRRWRE